MIDIKFLRENPEVVKENIRKKFQDEKLPLVDEVIELDAQSRTAQKEADDLRANRNKISKEIGKLMQSGQKEAAEKARQETADLKSAIAGLNSRRTEVSNELTDILLRLPNMPHASVAKGKSEADNEIVKIVRR